MLKRLSMGICCLVATIFVLVSVAAYLVSAVGMCEGETITVGELAHHARSLPAVCRVSADGDTLSYSLAGLPIKKVKVNLIKDTRVYPGGMAIGFSLKCEGALVVAVTDLTFGDAPAVAPARTGGVSVGDVITGMEGCKIGRAADIEATLLRYEGNDKPVCVTVRRRGELKDLSVLPARDPESGKYKLGIMIREATAGIGTVTYVREDNTFGALGHPVFDSDTASLFPAAGGEVFPCAVIGIVKGEKGKPGELRGLFVKDGKTMGNVKTNNRFGVYGSFAVRPDNELYPDMLAVGGRASARPGKAKLVTTIDNRIGEYEVEIVKTNYQISSSEKSMVIKVTDATLLARTGGIVQGMSGSPIIQNNKVIGAVTHVFMNDPTRGYGLYIDWMLE